MKIFFDPPQRPRTDHPDRKTPDTRPVERRQIAAEHGLQAAAQLGWPALRAELTQMTYRDIVQEQVRQIAALKLQASAEATPPEQELVRINTAAKERASRLVERFFEEYPKSAAGANGFYSERYGEEPHKLRVRGILEAGGQREYPLTRLYVTTQIARAPEAFIALFNELRADDLLQYCDFTLLLETFADPTAILFGKSYLNVTTRPDVFILYVRRWPGVDVLGGACRALERTVKAAPELWQIPASDLAKLKEWFLYRLSVPLSDNIALVEQEDDDSFDTIWLPRLHNNLFRQFQFHFNQAAWESAFAAFNPDNPGAFNRQAGHLYFNGQLIRTEDILAQRRKYMPTLVF